MGCESAAAGMEERSLGTHPQVASVEMRAHEGMSGPTGKSSYVKNELLAAARRAALERWARGLA